MSPRSYLAAAFNARPLGMKIPPNWAGLAAFGLLGAFLNPGFLLIGAGLEVAYLAWLSRSPRFRELVDAGGDPAAASWDDRRRRLLEALEPADRRRQEELEARCAEIADGLRDRTGAQPQIEGLAGLAWMHLRLLAARAGLRRVAATALDETRALDRREADLRDRLSRPEVDPDLRRTLEQQAEVIEARRKAHAEATQRLARVDAEVERIAEQVALVREQALLAADDAQVASSVDALSASLNEANRWLQEDRNVLAGLDLDSGPPPDRLFGKSGGRRPSTEENA
jgi:hypothetical protein